MVYDIILTVYVLTAYAMISIFVKQVGKEIGFKKGFTSANLLN